MRRSRITPIPSDARCPLRVGVVFAILALFLCTATLHAQVNTGTLSGLTLDPTGAAIPGVEIIVTSPSTGYARAVTSGSDGVYTLPNLPTGDYNLSATLSGFSKLEEHAQIGVGERVRLDLHLAVGVASETVEVAQSGVNLSKDDASIGTIVTKDTIEETPLYLRNWDDLLRTVPGVQIGIAAFATGVDPIALALSPNGNRLYIANSGLFEYETVPGADNSDRLYTGLHFPLSAILLLRPRLARLSKESRFPALATPTMRAAALCGLTT